MPAGLVTRRPHPGDGRAVLAEVTASGRALVERATAGYNAAKIEGKGSLRAVWQAEITFTDVRVPDANRLPGANGFKDVCMEPDIARMRDSHPDMVVAAITARRA